MKISKNFCLIALLLLFFALIAGCATLTLNVKVNSDETISQYYATVETTSMVYNLIGGQIKSNIDTDLFDYDEKWTGDKVTITMKAKRSLVSTDLNELKIQRIDNIMYYEDTRLVDPDMSTNEYSSAMLNSFVVNYNLEMPGKIIDSNADKVKDNKAEWHLTGEKAFNTRIYAKSEIPASIPGFGVVMALFGLIFGFIVVKKRYN